MGLESPMLKDGDAGFVGYASRLNPLILPAGMLQVSENMRLDRGVAVTRKGAKRMADDISPSGTPLTVPFILAPSPSEPVVRAVYSGGIFASCVMRSPDTVNSVEAIILAAPDRAFTYIDESLSQYSGQWSTDILAVDSNNNLTTDTGEEIVLQQFPRELTYPTSPDETVDVTDNVSMMQAHDRVYLFREADTTQPGWGTFYTSGLGISVAGTVATVNVVQHGYSAGMRVRIEGSASPAFDGHEYDIVTVAGNSFTVTVPSGTAQDISPNISVRRVKPPIYWDCDPTTDFVRAPAGIPDVGITYRRMRSAPWAEYVNNRMIVPDGKQQVMLSDIFDPDVYDPFWQSFRLDVGGTDALTAVFPWVEGTFLVFCRKSIWLATVGNEPGASGASAGIDTAISKLELLTDEVGCLARRTIKRAGQYVYFLSDSGVYRLDMQLELKLRGMTKPLSDPIADQLDNLNHDLIKDAVGLYFSNRYYLAVPLANATDSNNGVFIYNQLNEQWETRDLYGFGVGNFLVYNIANERRVLVSNRAGKLMLLDELENGDQSPDAGADVTTAVPGRIVTRRYSLSGGGDKRFTRSLSDVYLPNGAGISVSAITTNPDSVIELVPGQTNTSGDAEDYTLKQPIRAKAHYCELQFSTTAGRPEIRTVYLEGAGKSLFPTETRNAA